MIKVVSSALGADSFSCMHAFFISNTFIRNARPKLEKNQTNAKQHPEAELLLFENCLHSSSTFLSKNNTTLKNKQNNKCVCIHEIIQVIMMKVKMKNRSHSYDKYRPKYRHGHKYRPKYRHGHKYSKYKKSVSMMMVLCIKHCLSSIDAQFIKKG